jgi:hypothetical protein
MSERLIEAAERQFAGGPGAPVPVPQVVLVREAVALLGWGTMVYACDRCGFEWKVWLALGVEGPPNVKSLGLYVPAPFKAGRCPSWPVKPDATPEERATFRHLTRCDGEIGHVRFREDEEFEPALIPDDSPRFVLDHWYDCAHLHVPEPALIVARRFHSER